MKASLIFGSLIASITQAALIGPCPKPETDTCLRGGMPQNPCTGPKCAPCWVAQDKENWGCYEFDPKTGKCPFPDMFNIREPLPAKCNPKPTECPNLDVDICYRGNIDQYPCTDGCCPRCWLKMNGRWGCFEPINGKCEWDGMIDIENPPASCPLL